MAKAPKGVVFTGEQFRAFWRDPNVWSTSLPGGKTGSFYVEDEEIWFDGELLDGDAQHARFGDEFVRLSDAAKVVIVDGALIPDETMDIDNIKNLAREARKWLNAQNTMVLQAVVPKDISAEALAQIRAAIEAAGGKPQGTWPTPAGDATSPKPGR